MSGPGSIPAASAIAAASACSGGSLQLEKTSTSGRSGSRRKARATLARSSDDFPTPLGP
jgi:hypothetical protein